MDPRPILPSATDLERRRLESTIDQDLHSLSLASLITTSNSASLSNQSRSFSSISSVEYPRGLSNNGPHGTPRAASRQLSVGTGESPVSTAGHHVSAMTLADGVFNRKHAGGRGGGRDEGFGEDDWDPERSLGRLVGELGRVMSDRISPRPTSPFSPPRSPHSPSPFPSLNNPNLSFTLNRNDPLPSPPASRSGSGSSGDYTVTAATAKPKADTGSRFTSMARELGNELRSRRVLGESTVHNAQHHQTPAPRRMKEKVPSRVRALQDEGRRSSAPGRVERSADVTGLTGLMETPAKGGEFGGLGKNGEVGGDAGATIPQTLATLHARLRALETENSLCRRRVRELEGELERAKSEVEEARRDGDRRLREVVGEKTALEDLVKSLRSHLARLTIELEQNKALVSELRIAQQPNSPPRPSRNGHTSVHSELADLRREVERLDKEVQRLGGIVEEGLETRRKARGERTVRMEADDAAKMLDETEVDRVRRDVEKRQQAATSTASVPSKLRQGLHTAAANQAQLIPPTVQPPTRTAPPPPPPLQRPTPPASEDGNDSPTPASRSSSNHRHSRRIQREEGPASPFPSIRAEDEGEFFAALHEDTPAPPAAPPAPAPVPSPWAKKFVPAPVPVNTRPKDRSKSRSPSPLIDVTAEPLPPQTVLARVLRELEDDFAHYKAVYAELADSYKVLDAASALTKRKILAQHLREVIDTLEQKADQISSLYDLLKFSDKPNTGTVESHGGGGVKKSVPDILRMVQESLGEEGMRRLEEDGVGRRLHRVV